MNGENMPDMTSNDFLRMVEGMAEDWKVFITGVNTLRRRGVKGRELLVEASLYSRAYQRRIASGGSHEWERVFSPQLCDFVRQRAAMQVLSQYYVVVQEEVGSETHRDSMVSEQEAAEADTFEHEAEGPSSEAY
jgi:hypothetical protein